MTRKPDKTITIDIWIPEQKNKINVPEGLSNKHLLQAWKTFTYRMFSTIPLEKLLSTSSDELIIDELLGLDKK